MFAWLKAPLRHPLYPDLPVTPARGAGGQHAALAGSFHELAQAARLGARASRAILLLHAGGGPLPGAAEREQLWRWFPVPSFLLVLDAGGRLKAYECEARDGLHLAAGRLRAGEPESRLCPCGRTGPRVAIIRRSARAIEREPVANRVST